ncbi:PepSY-associated TM helix domain-containing protein [Colwellia sp. MEBiC06753]
MAKSNYRLWFKIHGYLSLPIWLLFCFICITGTISVISHELTWLTNPAARATNPENLPAKPIAELVKEVKNTYPTADVSAVVAFEPYLVHGVIFTDKDHPYAIAYVNQYTGEIQSINPDMTFINFMRSLHGWLLFPWHVNYSLGYYLVSLMAIVMLGALITGIVIYKKFWRSFFAPKVRVNQGKKTLVTDLHKLSGVWSMWFLLLMSLTGLWYLVQAIIWHADIEIEPEAPTVTMPAIMSEGKPAAFTKNLNDVMEAVKAIQPEFTPSYVMLPEHNRDTYKLFGSAGDVFYDSYSYNYAVDPWTGAIVHQYTPSQMNITQTIAHITDPLHYGNVGGLWTKALWFIFGVIISGMSITGFMIWGSRNAKILQRHATELPASKIDLDESTITDPAINTSNTENRDLNHVN